MPPSHPPPPTAIPSGTCHHPNLPCEVVCVGAHAVCAAFLQERKPREGRHVPIHHGRGGGDTRRTALLRLGRAPRRPPPQRPSELSPLTPPSCLIQTSPLFSSMSTLASQLVALSLKPARGCGPAPGPAHLVRLLALRHLGASPEAHRVPGTSRWQGTAPHRPGSPGTPLAGPAGHGKGNHPQPQLHTR